MNNAVWIAVSRISTEERVGLRNRLLLELEDEFKVLQRNIRAAPEGVRNEGLYRSIRELKQMLTVIEITLA